MKILVRATNWLGDAVMSIPALRQIRAAIPAAEIAVLARPWVADLYEREDFCDRILQYEAQGRHRGVLGKLRLAAELREERFQTAILLQNAFDAALLAWLARIPERIGYASDGRGPLLTRSAALPRPGETPPHQRFYYLEMLRRTGLIERPPANGDIRLSGVERARSAGKRRWQMLGLPAGPWVGVSPGAAYGGAKRWLPERFAAAAAEAARRLDARVAIFGSSAEAPLCDQIAAQIGDRARSFGGRTSLAEYIELAATCQVYLTNDSGPMHVAAALGCPTVAIFGATDHVATGPSASWAKVLRQPVECSPCLLRECPIDHRCMTGVCTVAVVEAALELHRTCHADGYPLED